MYIYIYIGHTCSRNNLLENMSNNSLESLCCNIGMSIFLIAFRRAIRSSEELKQWSRY